MGSVADNPLASWRREWPLALAVAAWLATLFGGGAIGPALESPAILIGYLALLCIVILTAAVAIVHHAEILAHRLGEPAGTLLLTLAITGLEVAMVAFVMASGAEKPTLARDTMFAAVMLVLNGFMSAALLLGGLRHREQIFNLQGANAFLVMILPLTVLGLVLPNFTHSTDGPTLSTPQMVLLSLMSVGIYTVFLLVQNRWHREYFVLPRSGDPDVMEAADHSPHSTRFHGVMLACYGLPLVLLAKKMGQPLDLLVARLGAPPALSGLIMALLVLTPESLAAIRAALDNQIQRSVNVLLGSVLASIGLTIPLVIMVSLVTGRRLVLGLESAEVLMLVLTLVTSMLTFSLPRTNILLGSVHALLFGAFLMLLFD